MLNLQILGLGILKSSDHFLLKSGSNFEFQILKFLSQGE